MSLVRLFTNSLRARVLLLVLLGFASVAVPAFFAFQWVVNSTVVQLGTLFAEKQVLYDRHRGLGTLVREVSLAEALAGSQAIRDWAQDETDPERRRRGIAELEHYRRYFADGSYFFVVGASGNYYFNDSANSYAGDQFRYTLKQGNPDDAWYYSTLALGDGCHLNVNNDANLKVTKVWMNCVIREGREVLGLLGTGIDLTSFIQEVVNIPQRGVTSMFVDRQGMIQAHRDETLVSGARDDETLRQLFADVTEGGLLANSAFVTVNGKQTLVGIGYLDKLGWYNVTFMDVDTIIDRRLFVPIGLLLATMMVVVVAVLVMLFRNQVLDRLTRLEHVVRKARAGDYGPALSMGAGRQDEIGRLSSALTEMAARVDDHTRLLETKVRERTQELESLAFRDGQSGILNRRGFAEAHADVAGSGVAYGILLVDVDHFKQINDNHGHAAGDVVIVSVARRIQETIGSDGTCARWGGDEFIVLLPECGPKALRARAQDIMRAAIEEPIEALPNRTIVVSLSIGACLAERGDKLEVATDMADAALYTAKQAGRGRVVVFDKDMRPDPRRHVA